MLLKGPANYNTTASLHKDTWNVGGWVWAHRFHVEMVHRRGWWKGWEEAALSRGGFRSELHCRGINLSPAQFSSVQFSCSVMSISLWPHGLQHAKPPCPSPAPGVYSNSSPSSWWCHPTISSSVFPFSSCLQSFPTSGSFSWSKFFTSGGQSTGVSASASALPTNIQDWFPLGWTGWLSLQSKGLSRVFSNTKVQKHQFFGAQLSLWSNSHIHAWLLEKP